ncbi:hypothetical protein MMC25_002075 [Agyrium rufum]|nr:hypothetical protein [Agyrium rufum]
MSSYLSSLIIQPVVRRFSRPIGTLESSRIVLEDTGATVLDGGAIALSPEIIDSPIEGVPTHRLEAQIHRLERRHDVPTSNPGTEAVSNFESRTAPRRNNEGRDGNVSAPLPIGGRPHAGSGSTNHSALSRSDTDMSTLDGQASPRGPSANFTARGRTPSYNNQRGDGGLPADDGMKVMRRRIKNVQDGPYTREEKSRLMHSIMTEQYSSSQSSLAQSGAFGGQRRQSPASIRSARSHDRPVTPVMAHSPRKWNILSSPSLSIRSTDDMPDLPAPTAEDRIPTFYVPPPNPQVDASSADLQASQVADEVGESQPFGRSIRNMEMTFKQLDRDIRDQPMPTPLRNTKVLVYCNDCQIKTAVPFHWLGQKCAVCDSYNTVQINTVEGSSVSPDAPITAEAHTMDMDSVQPSVVERVTAQPSQVQDPAFGDMMDTESQSAPTRHPSLPPDLSSMIHPNPLQPPALPPFASIDSRSTLSEDLEDLEDSDLEPTTLWGGFSSHRDGDHHMPLRNDSERNLRREWHSDRDGDGSERREPDDSDNSYETGDETPGEEEDDDDDPLMLLGHR